MLTGRAFKFGDDISTNHIIPGKYAYLRSNLTELAKHVMEDADPTFVTRVKPGDFIVGVLKDPANYELYSFEELGRGEPETVETGREICTGQYGGISGFRHIMNEISGEMTITFRDAEEAEKVLELVRYANVAAQKPLVEDELIFIAKYPEIARELMTMTPLDYMSE